MNVMMLFSTYFVRQLFGAALSLGDAHTLPDALITIVPTSTLAFIICMRQAYISSA